MKKVLIVAMADSVHTARWIRQFDDNEIEFVLFPSTPHRRIHPILLEQFRKKSRATLKISKFMKFGALPLGVIDLVLNNFFRAKLLANEIKSFKPDLLHIMETQHAGYLTDQAFKSISLKPKTILSVWGSDFNWFGQFSRHSRRIKSLLTQIEILITECSRDKDLACGFGYKGACINGVPASGGFNYRDFEEENKSVPPSKRKIIAIKGYSGFVGLGPMALKTMAMISDLASNYCIVVYSASPYTRFIASRVRSQTGLNIESRKKHSQTPAQMRALFLNSRVVIGVSKSDGLPATVKEAVFTGAFPIQTDTSCAGEWFENGISVLLIPPQSPIALEQAIRRALQDDELVDNAAIINFEIAKSRMDSDVVRSKIISLYN